MNKQREWSLLKPNNNATPSVEVWAAIKYSWPDNKSLGCNCVFPLIIVYLFTVVVPDTFCEDIHVVLLFNVVVPDTLNDD